MDTQSLRNELTAAEALRRETMGLDPTACLKACAEISRLRLLLRDDAAMNAHLAVCLTTPLSVGKSNRRARTFQG